MRRKGFTLVELLVVIAIIALLMSILMPALAQVRRLAQRIVCGTHLAAIGKAMLVYAQDNEQDFVRAGGKQSKWSTTMVIKDWKAVASGSNPAQYVAFGVPPSKPATIASCFYMLIKYSDGIPKIFNCAGDLGSHIFNLADCTAATVPDSMKDAFDFGNGLQGTYWPGEYVSYSYHMPFTWGTANRCYALQSSDSAASPLCADRNPYIDKNARDYIDTLGGKTKDEKCTWTTTGLMDPDKVRNSAAHQREGQNVLYVDGHVEFESSPNCGVQNDFIWINWDPSIAYSNLKAKDRQFRTEDCRGFLNNVDMVNTNGGPQHIEDAFLINEYNDSPANFKP